MTQNAPTYGASDFLQLREFVQERMRVETDHGGEIEELDHIQPTLSGLDVGDERLVSSERGRYLDLRHPPIFAVLNDQLGQTLLAG